MLLMRSDRALRSIALLEAVKGLVALCAAVGLLGLLEGDMHHALATLVSHIGLKPGARYPALVLSGLDEVLGRDSVLLIFGACAYALVRLSEAYGLWFGRAWGPWLGAISGGLYVPFELWHLWHRTTALGLLVLALNLLLVCFLVWQLRRTRPREGAAPSP